MSTSFPQQRILSMDMVNNCYEGLMFGCHSGEIIIPTTAETPLMLIVNPSNSGVCVANIFRKMVALTNQKTATFRFYINPTVTNNGTANEINNLRIDGNVPTSLIKSYLSPTVSANGNHISTTFVDVGTIYDAIPILFDPGASFLVTAQVQSNGDKVSFDFTHYEINP